MSEQAKTIGALLAASKKSMVASHKKVVADLPEAGARNDGFFLGVAYAADKFKAVNDYRIVGPGCVVSPEGLEATARGVAGGNETRSFEDMSAVQQEHYMGLARAALEAAGIVVADEVVEVEAHPEESFAVPVMDDGYPHPQVMLRKGDKLYVVRATVTSCDTSEDGTGIDKGE